ncbi:MAG: MFS transporter [Hyphomicrobiales bacterium]|nr:MFS transporter [Hyphomicrobiales bacterium]
MGCFAPLARKATSGIDLTLQATNPVQSTSAMRTTLPILAALSLSHCLNDLIQSLLPAIYPILKRDLSLDFAEIGIITLVFQITASLLQPLVGIATDKKPQPYSLAIGMICSLVGLLLLSRAHTLGLVLIAAAIIGTGSSIFHPESSRVARAASGGRFGFAQSFFQVGGNTGQAIGPLLAAIVIAPYGQSAIAWFAIVAFAGMAILAWVGRWYAAHLGERRKLPTNPAPLTRKQWIAIAILLVLVFSKNFYMASLQSFYTFYLIERFHLSIQDSQLYLFVFMFAIAAGTFFGGPIGDRFGRVGVIWISIVGVLPFSLALPFANFAWTIVLTGVIGFVMASSFPAILVYAQELAPGRVGMIGGLFFGFAFGTGGLGAALLGILADHTSLDFVYRLCSILPAIGVLMLAMPKRDDVAQTAH